MNKKKILIFEAYPMFSGAQKISLNFCKALRGKNFFVTLLLVNDPNNILREKFGPYVDEIVMMKASGKITRFGNFNMWLSFGNFVSSFFTGLLPFYGRLISFFAKKKFDFIYFCDPRGAVSMLPSAFFRAKKICYLQSKNKHGKFLARLLYLTYVDKLLCPSADVLNSVPPSKKKIILHYGIDFSQHNTIINTDKLQKQIENLLIERQNTGRLVFLYGGLIKPQKGVHHIIYSMKALKDKRVEAEMPVLFILGKPANEPEEKFKVTLQEYIDKNGLSKYVYWMGWQNNILEWMTCANYFLFATIDKENCEFEGFDKIIESSEGSPTVLIESSLCRLFTIAAKVTGVNEIITNNENGILYNPSEKDGLLNAMDYVIENKPAFKSFPTKELFTIEKFNNNVLALFE